jgi:hypothetical protein
MLISITIGFVLLQSVNPQTAVNQAISDQQQWGQQASQSANYDPETKVVKSPDGAVNGQQQNQNDVSQSFQRTQLKQYWILVATGIITSVVLVVYTGATLFYTVFARRQWLAIKDQAQYSNEQVTILKTQSQNLGSQVSLMQEQLHAIKEQASVMRESLGETRRIAEQNERVVKAAEESAATAKESVSIEQRAYVEVKDMKMLNLAPGMKPTVRITWVNGGRTPAWHLRCLPKMVIGSESPPKMSPYAEDGLNNIASSISGSFLPPGDERNIDYEMLSAPTNEEIAQLSKNRTDLYIIAAAFYTDARGVTQQTDVCAVFDYHKGTFSHRGRMTEKQSSAESFELAANGGD